MSTDFIFNMKPINLAEPQGASSLEYVLQVRDGGAWPEKLGHFVCTLRFGTFGYREDLQTATRFPTAGAAAEAIARRDQLVNRMAVNQTKPDIRCSIVPVRVTLTRDVTEVVELEPAKTVVDIVGGDNQPISGFVIRDNEGDYIKTVESDGTFYYTQDVAGAERFGNAQYAVRALDRRYKSDVGKLHAPHVIVPVFLTTVPAKTETRLVAPARTTITLA